MPSSTMLSGTASRRPSNLAGIGATGLSSARMASISAQQATLLASGPTESNDGASGSTPVIGTRRAVGL
jgi:hypothetical protein